MSNMFKKEIKVNGSRRKVAVEVFASADELAKACQTRQNTDSRFNDMKAEAEADWHGADYQTTMNLLKNGYQEAVESLKGCFAANVSGAGKRFKFQNAPVGFAPVVPLALMGVPNSMIDMRIRPIKAKVVDIYFDMSCHCGISSEDITKASLKILGSVVELERQGYRFNLYSTSGYWDGNGDLLCVKVKSAEQPLDLKRVSFPMTHTAFFRVLGFDWYGKFPLGTYRMGYGRPAYKNFGSDSKKVKEAYQQIFGNKNLVFFSAQELVDKNFDQNRIKEELENGNSKNR